jgi:hypothetical protein
VTPDLHWSERNLLQAAAEGKQITEAEIRVLTDRLVRARGAHDAAVADRDRWVRLFNRLEAAVSHHKRALGYEDDDAYEPWDEALYKARAQILRDAAASGEPTTASATATGEKGQPGNP